MKHFILCLLKIYWLKELCMGFTIYLSNGNDAEQAKETEPHHTCLTTMLECAWLTFCALCTISACSGVVFGGW